MKLFTNCSVNLANFANTQKVSRTLRRFFKIKSNKNRNRNKRGFSSGFIRILGSFFSFTLIRNMILAWGWVRDDEFYNDSVAQGFEEIVFYLQRKRDTWFLPQRFRSKLFKNLTREIFLKTISSVENSISLCELNEVSFVFFSLSSSPVCRIVNWAE